MKIFSPRAALWAAFLALLTFGPACDCGDPDKVEPTEVPKPVEASNLDAGQADATPEHPREAFGVPLPPELLKVDIRGGSAYVITSLLIPDVESFYKTRLVDYEHVQQDKWNARFLGLHEHQPNVQLRMRTRGGPTRIRIEPKVVGPVVKVEETVGADAGADVAARPKRKPRQKGQPVETRLPNGELFAPGAKWGESYWPPEGSPLAHPRYRSNWGKPYGEWITQ